MVDEVQAKVTREVKRLMRETYLETRRFHFWPEQFVERGVGTQEQVLHAFLALDEVGNVECLVSLRCDDGHEVWAGRWSEMQHAPQYCEQCEDFEGQLQTFIHAELTSDWTGEINGVAANEEKKSPAIAW